MKQDDFGRRIGLSGSRVSELEHGKGGAGAGVLIAICREFPVSHEWMLGGKGAMLRDHEGEPPDAAMIHRISSLEEQVRLIMLDKAPDTALITIPLYSSSVAAGMPCLATSDIEEQIEIPASWSHGKKNVFAVTVQGESMIDSGIMPGDRLIVESVQTARDEQIVIASVDGEMTVKKLNIDREGNITLEPRNSAYAPIPVTPDMDFRILGVVIASMRSY
jgi:SOS regulatory protein LexA